MAKKKTINHEERSHAIVSPSAAERWTKCPLSARLNELVEEQFGKEESSKYAKWGTDAHEHLNQIFSSEFYTNRTSVLSYLAATVFEDKEMHDTILKCYDEVIKVYDKAKANDPNALLCSETKLDYSDFIPEGTGIADIVICTEKKLYVMDFKMGEHVAVDAIKNQQLQIYAIAALQEYDYLYSFEQVECWIIQPRMDNIAHDTYSVEELNEIKKNLGELGLRAFVGDEKANPGEHCVWCVSRAVCRERSKYLTGLTAIGKEPSLLTEEEVVQIFNLIDGTEKYIKSYKSWLLDTMLKGNKINGLKLVESLSRRQYSADITDIEDQLHEWHIEDALIHKPRELVGLTDLEKVLKAKGHSTKELEDMGFIIKPQGAPKVVLASDNGKEYLPNDEIEFEAL